MHLNDDLKRRMRAKGVCLAVIPKGYTQYIVERGNSDQ